MARTGRGLGIASYITGVLVVCSSGQEKRLKHVKWTTL